MIYINKSETADTRSCVWSKVTEEQLVGSTYSHMVDVYKAISFFRDKLLESAHKHDHDKIEDIKQFHHDFTTGFSETTWWDRHKKINRHHLLADEGVPEDVNLIDVLEFVADCVMAGMARSGYVYDLDIKPEVLVKAFQNTVELLKSEVKVIS